MRSVEKLILAITVADAALGGGGYLIQVHGIRLRVILFTLCMAWVALRFTSSSAKTAIPKYFRWLFFVFVLLTGLDAAIGYIHGNAPEGILNELKPLSYFPMLFFFLIAIQDRRDVELTTTIIVLCGSVIAAAYLALLAVTKLGLVDAVVLSTELSTSDEFIFRGLPNIGFFYKGMFYAAIAGIFLLLDPYRFTKVIAFLVVIAIGLSLTRGLALAFTVCIPIGVLMGRDWKRAWNYAGIAVVLVATVLFASAFDKSSNASLVCLPGDLSKPDGIIPSIELFAEHIMRPTDEARVSDLNLLRDMDWRTLLLGHGFGSPMRPDGQTRIELNYIEILYKQGIWGLAIWAVFFVTSAVLYLKLPTEATRYGRPFFLTILFVYLANLTNPYLPGSIGMAAIFFSASSLRALSRQMVTFPEAWYGIDFDKFMPSFRGPYSAIKRRRVTIILIVFVTSGVLAWTTVSDRDLRGLGNEEDYDRLIALAESHPVHNVQQLKSLAYRAGLSEGLLYGIREGIGLAANVGTILRDAAGYITFIGYAFDEAPLCNPVHLYLFMAGRPVGSATAMGERPDVTAGFRLQHKAAENVGINGQSDHPIQCAQATDLFALIVNGKKDYMILEPTGTYPSNGKIPNKVLGCE